MMSYTENAFMKGLKRGFDSAVSGIKRLAGSAREKVDIDNLFARQAVKLKRISTNLVNLDATLLGIFDRKDSTLTIRSGEKLAKGDLVESEHVQYRVEHIRPEEIQVPLELNGKIHALVCRVAELKML